MKKLRVILIWVAMACAVFITPLVMSQATLAKGARYFLTANLKASPIRLAKESTKAEAIQHTAYYVATFHKDGRISVVCKVLRGRVFFRSEYEYTQDGGLLSVRTYNNDGSGYLNTFDKDGKQISEKKWVAKQLNNKLVLPD